MQWIAGLGLLAAGGLGFAFQPARPLTTTTGIIERVFFAFDSAAPIASRPASLTLSSDGRVARLVSDRSLFVSRDGGLSWAREAHEDLRMLRGVAQSGDARRVLAVGELGRMVFSENGGVAWTTLDAGMRADLLHVTLSADGRRGVASAANLQHGMLRTGDGGRTWSAVPVRGSQAALSGDGLLGLALALDKDQLWRTADGGESWQPVPDTPLFLGLALSADGRRAIALDSRRTIHVSVDGGVTWAAQAGRVPSQTVGGLSISADGRIAVTTSGGLANSAFSRDRAKTWMEIPGGVGPTTAALSADGRVMIAAGESIMLSSIDGGTSWRRVTRPVRSAPWWTIAAGLTGLLWFGIAAWRTTGYRRQAITRRHPP